jgi:hypothetical protein
MTIRELYDQHERNVRTLSSQAASTSALIQRVSAEQAAIEARLLELEGMETIQTRLNKTRISGEDDMNIDEPEHPTSRAIDVKRKVLSKYNPEPLNGRSNVGSLSFQEAIELEQRAHAQDLERQRRLEEKRKRTGLSLRGEVLTKQEREARIWAFMNAKPSESDLEDDSDEDDEDPSTWFEDDQDDGIKFQNIVQPDSIEELSGIIRIDGSKAHYSSFYEPRDID